MKLFIFCLLLVSLALCNAKSCTKKCNSKKDPWDRSRCENNCNVEENCLKSCKSYKLAIEKIACTIDCKAASILSDSEKLNLNKKKILSIAKQVGKFYLKKKFGIALADKHPNALSCEAKCNQIKSPTEQFACKSYCENRKRRGPGGLSDIALPSPSRKKEVFCSDLCAKIKLPTEQLTCQELCLKGDGKVRRVRRHSDKAIDARTKRMWKKLHKIMKKRVNKQEKKCKKPKKMVKKCKKAKKQMKKCKKVKKHMKKCMKPKKHVKKCKKAKKHIRKCGKHSKKSAKKSAKKNMKKAIKKMIKKAAKAKKL